MAEFSARYRKRRKVIRIILWISLLVLIFTLFAIAISWVVNADERNIKKILNMEITNTPTPTPTGTPTPTPSPTPSPTPVPPKGTIIIDPGHGGTDDGSNDMLGIIDEKDITLEIALLLRTELRNRGYNVLMTREDDLTTLSNKERVAVANSMDAAILLSLHMNTYPSDRTVKGLEVLYDSSKNDSKKLATALVNPICSSCGAKNRGIKARSNISILKDVSMPSVDIEMGFISCPEEVEMFENAEYKQKLVSGICDGVDKYMDGIN